MPIEMFNHCLLCNPEVNWLEVELRSERNEPITGLTVTITNPSSGQTLKKSAPQGRVRFENIVAAEWVVNVDTDTLLSKVEQYASRKDNEDSPVQTWTKEQKDCCGNPKAYYHVTVGDLWESPPKDSFLVEHHGPSKKNYRDESKGFRTSHNRSSVLEIKALRSYMPMIVDTDEFSLVNSYTFALLSKLAYASAQFGIPDDRNPRLPEGGIDEVVEQLKLKRKPLYCASSKEDWLLSEIPYSQHLKADYYQDTGISAEGYILSNDAIAIIGIRGTQTYFGNETIDKLSQKEALIAADKLSAIPILKIAKVADGVIAGFSSPGYQDTMTDLDISQIAPLEFGGAYVHRGFYRYAMALWKSMEDDVKENHRNKNIYISGHSLGGAGAFLLSALIYDVYSPSTLRLHTYGMPRVGTHSFAKRYRSIVHYRHVNNHDIVPQVPMRWMNTNSNEKSEPSSLSPTQSQSPYPVAESTPTKSLWAILKDKVVDSDEDNYQHHGNLIQLLTFSVAKHQPDSVEQVLLTHRQTHISSLTLATNKENDACRLTETLSNDHIDINGYITTFKESLADHSLAEYIPNLKQQLTLFLEEKSTFNYQSALKAVQITEQALSDTYRELKKDELNALTKLYISRKNNSVHAQQEHERSQILFAIRQEIELTEKIALNIQRVRKEIEALVKQPELLPSEELLFGSQKLEQKVVKEQLQ